MCTDPSLQSIKTNCVKSKNMTNFYIVLCLLLSTKFISAQGDMVLHIYSTSHYSQDEKSDHSLVQVLSQIEKKFNVYFNFDPELLSDKHIREEVNISDNLTETLDRILNPIGLIYKRLGNGYYVIYSEKNADEKETSKSVPPIPKTKSEEGDVGSVERGKVVYPLQVSLANKLSKINYDKRVTGEVLDSNGEPLIGVNIQVKGTNLGTSTNIEGRFELGGLAENAVLVVSYIGYQTQEINVSGQSYFEIVLKEDSQTLDEIVVVGYGTQRKSDLTGAVASVSQDKLQSRPMTTFEDALQGRVSGMQIRQSGGDLDGRFSIAIRGIGSVTGSNDPLIVVDGVPLFSQNFSTINPQDIASIDVLKDASATAIYGARAANGVVIISTRKGNSERLQLTFSTDLGIEDITRTYDVMSTEEQRQLFVEAFKNSNRDISVYEDSNHPAWQVDTDWQKIGTRSALRQNYNLGFSGGSEKTQFSGSASYLNREGTMLNSDLQTWSMRMNVNSNINEWIKISTNLTGSHKVLNDQPADQWGAIGYRSFLQNHSYTLPYDENGELTAIDNTAAPYFGSNANPLIDLLLTTRESTSTRLLGNTKIDIEILENLVLSGNLGADLLNGTGFNYQPVFSIGNFNRPEGIVSVPNNLQINWVSDLTLNFSRDFDVHELNLLGGLSAQQFISRNNNVTGRGTIDNALNQLSNQTTYNSSGGSVQSGLNSSFLRANYGYKDKYLLTATIRRDGSSKFGPASRYGIFPSGSVAWRLSNEEFLQDATSIDDLKLRLSYGLTGNQSIGDFAFITRAGAAQYVFGNEIVVGNSPLNIGNPNLKWEASRQFDIGMDVSFFSGRIQTTLDFYDRESEDLLVSTPIPLTSGVGQNPIVNIGSVRNTGVEIYLSTRNIDGAFSWDTDFNISFNKNEIVDIGRNSIGNPLEIPGQLIPLSNQHANLSRAGHPVGAFHMYQFEGIWQLGEEEAATHWSGAVPGDPRYKDLNGNGVLDDGDKSFVGNPHPKFFGGMDNTFTYGNFSLSIFLNFAGGNKLYNTARNLYARGVPFVQNFREVNGFWTTENPSNTVPRPSQGGNTTTLVTLVSDRYLEKADFLRVKNIRLSYDFKTEFFRGNILESARVTLNATNLFTFTPYTGLDPESSSREDLLSAGLDYTPYPLTSLVSLGIQVNF